MTGFVLCRIDQWGGYVAPPGRRSSYTTNIQDAWVFRTKEEAERNRCIENEVIVDLSKRGVNYAYPG